MQIWMILKIIKIFYGYREKGLRLDLCRLAAMLAKQSMNGLAKEKSSQPKITLCLLI